MDALIIVPEPAAWLAGVAGDIPGTSDIFAPWAMAARAPRALPRAVRAFVARRQLSPALRVPGWWLGEAALRAWAGSLTERTLRGRFAVRATTDWFAARVIRRHRPARVIAPSCAAWRSFAAARQVGARCVLIEDLPDLRGLHDDLDRAVAAHPTCRFLTNYRAPDRALVRQEVERALADEFWVRSRHAAARLGDAADVRPLPTSAERTLAPKGRANRPRVLLAGLAAARNGSVEALAMLERLPHIELVIRPGAGPDRAGMEPRGLLEHPRVVVANDGPIDVVIAPAWVECHPPEVAAACAANIPVVATARAAGWSDVVTVEPGDVTGLTAAVARALSRDTPLTTRSPSFRASSAPTG